MSTFINNLYKKISFFLILTLILQSCTYGGYNKELDFKLKQSSLNENQDKAVIVFKLVNHNLGQIIFENKETKKLIYTSEYEPYSGFVQTIIMLPIYAVVFVATFGSIILYGKKHYKPIPSNQYIALEIPEGTYNFKEIISTNNINLKVDVDNFKINKSEVVYLGDLEFTLESKFSSKHCVNYKNTLEDVKDFIKTNHPDLTTKEVKQLFFKNSEKLKC